MGHATESNLVISAVPHNVEFCGVGRAMLYLSSTLKQYLNAAQCSRITNTNIDRMFRKPRGHKIGSLHATHSFRVIM